VAEALETISGQLEFEPRSGDAAQALGRGLTEAEDSSRGAATYRSPAREGQVPATQRHYRERTVTSVSNRESVGAELEGAVRKRVGNLGEQGLIGWVAAAKSEEADALIDQVDFGTNETMWPMGIDGKAMAEK